MPLVVVLKITLYNEKNVDITPFGWKLFLQCFLAIQFCYCKIDVSNKTFERVDIFKYTCNDCSGFHI